VTTYVVDASVAMKWFVPEELSQEALTYLNDEHELLTPDLLWPEFANIAWKKVRRNELSAEEARHVLSLCHQVPFEIVESMTLIDSAFDIAVSLDRTVYDSVYLALAVLRDCVMITADRRLYNALQAGPTSQHIAHLGDV